MYECPNCSANLKYNIEKCTLFCEHCQTTMSPYLFEKEQDAEVRTEYDVTVFTCPQCGGEIISDDTTAATFCSYCGSATILTSRLHREKYPKYIVPFTKTEKDCRDSYKKMMKKAIFAPRDLKDENHIKKFRGIYMPYWVYSFEKNSPITFTGSQEYRDGDYIVTSHYNIESDMEAEYSGIAFDASSTFCDSLSEAIAPFNIKKAKPFTPSFLSGFYADTSDVDESLYMFDAEQTAINLQYEHLIDRPDFLRYRVDDPMHSGSLKNALTPDTSSADLALFPVWFLSYRKKDRVAYATINGQTGKVVADLPVDTKKYILGSLLLTIPLFLLLNLFFTLRPNWLLIIICVLTFICMLISNAQVTNILQREKGEDDKGAHHKKWFTKKRNTDSGLSMMDYIPETDEKELEAQRLARLKEERMNRMRLNAEKDKKVQDAVTHQMRWVNTIYIVFLIIFTIVLYIVGLEILVIPFTFLAVPIQSLFTKCLSRRAGLATKPFSIRSFFTDWSEKLPYMIKPFIGLIVAILVLIINPVSDGIYYICALFCMGLIVWAFADIIKRHNILTTHKLPQLNKRGGDEVE